MPDSQKGLNPSRDTVREKEPWRRLAASLQTVIS